MKFRPCIDIHNGKVKQIVGGSLQDAENRAVENFVSDCDGGFYGRLYRSYDLAGGHIILLNPSDSPYYAADLEQAEKALSAYPGGLMIGGGVTAENAERFIRMGATHVIVTSYVFYQGKVNYERLKSMQAAVGKEHLVLDLSCRKRDGRYYIVTDRWQNFTDTEVTEETLAELAEYADEYLIHAVDVEGKASGIECDLAAMLGKWDGIPVTYAGGVSSFRDLDILRELGNNKVDVTIGSALSIFGGKMQFEDVITYMRQ